MPIVPIKKEEDNPFLRISNLSVYSSGSRYCINLRQRAADACVLCISKEKPISAEEAASLHLTEEDLKLLFNGGSFARGKYTFQGITSHELDHLGDFQKLEITPPAYVQAWVMKSDAVSEAKSLYVPEISTEQTAVVSVSYHVSKVAGAFTVHLDQTEGYNDGDLLYRVENDHLPIPIPQNWIGKAIPMNCNLDELTVYPDTHATEKYIETNRSL